MADRANPGLRAAQEHGDIYAAAIGYAAYAFTFTNADGTPVRSNLGNGDSDFTNTNPNTKEKEEINLCGNSALTKSDPEP